MTKPEESGVTRDSKQALLPDESAKAEALSETPVVQKSSNSGSNSGQQKTEGDDPVAKLTDEIASLEARLRGPIDKQSENRLLRQVSRLFAMREGLRESLKGKGEQSLPQESALARIEESDDFSSTLDSQLFDASTAAGAGLKALDSELTKLSDQVLKAGADGKELRTLEHAVGALRQKKEQLLVNQLYGAKDIVPAPLEEEIRRLAMPGLGSTALSDLQYADALNAAKWLVSGEYEDSIDQLVKEKAQITSRGEGKLDLIEGLEIEIEFRRAALSAMQQLDADYSIIRSKLGYAGGSTDALEDEELGLIESRARIFSLIGGLLRTSSDPGINAWVKEMVAREPDRAMVILDGIGAPGLFNSRRNPK